MVAWDVCPGEETIAAYAAGRLARIERDGVDSHIDTCSACLELVAALAKLATVDGLALTDPPSIGAASIPEEAREGWTPGGTLGRYVLLARLGAGGMGVVYSAYDPELDRRVAVKVLRRTRTGDRLRDEARAIAKLAHPNVIAVHDVGEADGEVFVAMEQVEGATVRDWLRAPRTTAEIVDVFVQAGRGLAAAHAAGIVHRDVKPSNIIVGADGRARVLDFGLAHTDVDASEGTIAGTPAYMAPEQRRAERTDARADQFAFAVALAEALFGPGARTAKLGAKRDDDAGGDAPLHAGVGRGDERDVGGGRGAVLAARDAGVGRGDERDASGAGGGRADVSIDARDAGVGRGDESGAGGGRADVSIDARDAPVAGGGRGEARRAWEARRDGQGTIARRDVSGRVRDALDRARSERPDDRFASMDDLLAELVPVPPRARVWVLVAALVAIGAVGAIVIAVTRAPAVAACEKAGTAIDRVWSNDKHDALRASFASTKIPYADGAAVAAITQLDAWTDRWRAQADATCRATLVDKVQPAATNALRTSCLDDLARQLAPIVDLATKADPEIVARAGKLVDGLPAPERCADVAALVAVPLPPAGSASSIEALRAELAPYEAAFLTGRAEKVRAQVMALRERAKTTSYGPIIARAELLVGRLEISAAHYPEGIAALHVAAQAATGARDLETLADVWIELSKALGNDIRTSAEADLFDGYAQALVGQLPDREERTLELAFARCNRNVTAAQAAGAAKHCEETIALGERTSPPRRAVVNAARARLGHFQRMQGDPDRALATLQAALDEAIAIHGPQHPEVAIARYVFGIALVDRESFDAGIAQLRQALAIREVAYPGGNVQVAESLIGLGDALGASGKAADSVEPIERGLAILESLGQGESAHAANAHILVGMSLQELARVDEALAHFVRGADIADRKLAGREAIVAMGLRLAASIEIGRESYAAAVPHLERAIRVLERGKASPTELGKTQFALGQVLFELGPSERDRAKAMVAAARASYTAAGAAGAAGIAEVDAFMRGR
jgi:tetratricopeptide (TPR) repeat protein/predicted Ser/Thr protein kinase